MNLMRAQRHAPMQQGRADAASGSTPQGSQYMNQLNRDYYDPGGGTLGNDIVGGGQVFSGFYRGQGQGGAPNVGNTSWLGGGSPGQYGSGFHQSPSWGAQNWLQMLLNMSPQNQAPYGYGTGSGFLTGELPQGANNAGAFHGGGPGMDRTVDDTPAGGGPGMVGFLNNGGSLASMDSLARGGSGSDNLGSPADGRYAE